MEWLPGYEHQPMNGGLDWTPGTAWKVCLHTTETPAGSAQNIINAWRNDLGRGMPHFWGDRPDRIIQTLPLTVGAYTLQNPPGGVDTNRAHVIQIEVCDYARNARTWSAPGSPWCKALGRWLADLVDAGIPLDLHTELTFGDRWVGMDPQAFLRFGGVFGHQHCPEQPDRHWDPGPIHIAAILAEARNLLAPTPAPEVPSMAMPVCKFPAPATALFFPWINGRNPAWQHIPDPATLEELHAAGVVNKNDVRFFASGDAALDRAWAEWDKELVPANLR